jgi:TolB-like protein/DNA-binding winged helix-turn-helix (wHTH) protein
LGKFMAQEFNFGDFTLDQARFRLQRGGRRVRLEKRPMELLILLVERRGELVSREEIAKHLWGQDVFLDIDHGINTAIRKVRQALRDDPEKPLYVETVVGKGYRFAAPVICNNGDQNPQTEPIHSGGSIDPAPAAQSTEKKSTSLRLWLALGTVVLAVLALAMFLYRGRTSKRKDQQAIRSVAVLPLKNLSGDSTQEYLADGMTEELIGRLSGISDLRVTSRTSVMGLKDTKLSVPEIAKSLHVDAIVEGSVIRYGNRIRVHAQLIRGATDEHFWSQAYDREWQDVLTLESDVAQAITDQVRVQLTPQQRAHLRSAREVNPDSYEAYLKGRFFQMTPTLQANKSAESYFQEAIQKDSTFALAYAGLADSYLDSGLYRWVRPQEAYRLSNEAIKNAMRLDKTLSEVHASVGLLYWRYDWDWRAAEKEFRYALELNPNNTDAREGLIWYLAWSGRQAEAFAELDKIRTSDPAYPLAIADEVGVYYHARDYEMLKTASHKAILSDPNIWVSHYFLAVSQEGLGRHAEAIPAYEKAVELSQGNTDAVAGLANAYAFAGKKVEATKVLRQLEERSKANYVSPYMLAIIHAALGEKSKAFALLEEAYQERSPDVSYFLKADLRLDPLRDDPRFKDLQRRVGLK